MSSPPTGMYTYNKVHRYSKVSLLFFGQFFTCSRIVYILRLAAYRKSLICADLLKVATQGSKVDSRDLQTSNILIWRYHCLGEVAFLKIWNQYWLPSDTVHQRLFFISPACPSSNLVYRSLESTQLALNEHWEDDETLTEYSMKGWV